MLASIIVLLVLVFDQFSKNIAKNYLNTTCNLGIAFGIKINATILILIILSLVLGIYFKEKKPISTVGFSLIFAGGISNFVDRINFGCVRDFISVFNFPVFNFADSVIVVGAIIAVFDMLILRK